MSIYQGFFKTVRPMIATAITIVREILPRPVKQTIRAFINLPKSLHRAYLCQPNIFSRLNRQLQRKPHTILFYPDHPCDIRYKYTLIAICHHLGYRMTNDPNKIYHHCIRWQDTTFAHIDDRLSALAKGVNIINMNCLDISKTHVDKIFQHVFGYSTKIDPKTFAGAFVEKSNLNGKHDGKIIEGPINDIKDDVIYQRLIDNSTEDQFAVDIRMPIFNNQIPFVFIKYKRLDDRFGLSVKATLSQPEQICSPDEINKCLSFCQQLGLDYGELDIARDRKDGRLYILDANNTPTIHYAGYTLKEKAWIIKQLSKAFETAL